jgi:hypothetical protein
MIDSGALQLGVKIEFRAGHFGSVRRDGVMPGSLLSLSKPLADSFPRQLGGGNLRPLGFRTKLAVDLVLKR